jgi:RimJ/RimL family protein N-acetyltransferase
MRWASGMGDRAGVPFGGFIWENDGSIVGNLSLIPMQSFPQKIFLIANVAVHPDHRRRGIARSLTEAALDETARRRADRLWLHVRADNDPARRLYESVGFREHNRRTTWYDTARPFAQTQARDIRITRLAGRHWHRTLGWLNRLHPPDLDWYLSLDVRSLRPGPLGWIHRLFHGGSRPWAAYRDGELLAVLSRQGTRAASDRLWLAAPEQPDPDALRMLLRAAELEFPGRRPLNLEYPAGQAAEALTGAGFAPHHTLIWMHRGG